MQIQQTISPGRRKMRLDARERSARKDRSKSEIAKIAEQQTAHTVPEIEHVNREISK